MKTFEIYIYYEKKKWEMIGKKILGRIVVQGQITIGFIVIE